MENPEDPSIQASSNPADYIDYNEETYNTLVEGGIYTMQYIVDEFSKGGQTGLKGHIMRTEDVEVMRYTLPYSYWYYTTIAS